MLSEAFNIDCMEGMKQFPDKYFELAVVDPPYGLPKDAVHGRGKLKARAINAMDMGWDVAPNEDYFKELFRVSEKQIIWGGNYFALMPTRCWLIWDKEQPFENFSAFEMAWTSFESPSKIYRQRTVEPDPDGKIHPTQKTIKLYDWIFMNYAKQGDKILDTHLGSGSSRISAHKAGLDFTAYELDKDYFDKQEKRFNNFISQLQLDFAIAI
ncbi:MAG: hypothetical protein M0P61_00315 [Ignavibacteriaceae bacterium]|jgi:site-specific DNA-methyltransferase (adenine-specific)|nr:hypothetical protein [Ignavibacteriaceae bacterium]